MNSNLKMSLPHQYRLHLWNAALLLASAAIALAASRLSAAPERRPAGAISASPEVSPFVAPVAAAPAIPSFGHTVAVDPFDPDAGEPRQAGVASGEPTPTVRTASETSAPGRRLTAILIADERRVAVIDEASVAVGDVLRDGSRVSAIQQDRVWVVEKSGRWQVLTLTTRGR